MLQERSIGVELMVDSGLSVGMAKAHTHPVMEVERTWITVLPKQELSGEPLASVSIFFEGDISADEVQEAIAGLNAEYWATDRRTKELNWGAASSSVEILIEIAQGLLDESFWVAVGFVVDRIWESRSQHLAPDPETTLHHAKQTILLAYPEERSESLAVIEEAHDAEDGTRSVTLRSPTHDHTVSLRLTPKGYPYVVGQRRSTRD